MYARYIVRWVLHKYALTTPILMAATKPSVTPPKVPLCSPFPQILESRQLLVCFLLTRITCSSSRRLCVWKSATLSSVCGLHLAWVSFTHVSRADTFSPFPLQVACHSEYSTISLCTHLLTDTCAASCWGLSGTKVLQTSMRQSIYGRAFSLLRGKHPKLKSLVTWYSILDIMKNGGTTSFPSWVPIWHSHGWQDGSRAVCPCQHLGCRLFTF